MKLSQRTSALVDLLFTEADRAEATLALEDECGTNLPFCDGSTPESLERLRFAAIKLSEGDLLRLADAIALAKLDWRDLLMAAEFGDVDRHLAWAREVLRGR